MVIASNQENNNQQQVDQVVNRNRQVGNILEGNFNPMEYIQYLNAFMGNMTEEEFDIYFHENSDQFFQVWKKNIWNLVYSQIQMPLEDLPDFPYRIMFDEGMTTPSQMFQHIMENIM